MIGKIVASVGNYFGNCNIEVSRLEKAPEVLFVTKDGFNKYINEDFYYIGDAWNICPTKCLYVGDGDFSKHETFHNLLAAKKYIDDNKPIYSKKQIREALENSFVRENYILDVPYCCADRFKEELFVKKLGL